MVTHLVAYDTPWISSPEVAQKRAEDRDRWPNEIVTQTELGRTLCGRKSRRDDGGWTLASVAVFETAHELPRSELCRDCVSLAAQAGKTLPEPPTSG